MWRRITNAITWDGLFPASVIVVTAALPGLWPRNLAIDPSLAALLLVMSCALVRAHLGYQRLQVVCGGQPGLGRQALLAFAIVVLLMFEAASVAIVQARRVTPDVVVYAAALYLVYFSTVLVALRPAAQLEA